LLVSQNSVEEMENRLRIMFGRGEVTEEQFIRLKNRLRQGLDIHTELLSAHRIAVARMGPTEAAFATGAPNEITRQLERLYRDRALLIEVRLEMDHAIREFQDELQSIRQQAQAAHAAAQSALPNEDAARDLLNQWQDLVELSELLAKRLAVLERDMSRLAALEASLKVSQARLKTLHSQAQFGIAQEIVGHDLERLA
jgi:hypothetical protein